MSVFGQSKRTLEPGRRGHIVQAVASGLAFPPRRLQINRLQRPSPGQHRCVGMTGALGTKMASCGEVNKRCCTHTLPVSLNPFSCTQQPARENLEATALVLPCTAGVVLQVLRVYTESITAWTWRACHRTW